MTKPLLVLALLFSIACLKVDVPKGEFACASGADCGTGMACVEGLCECEQTGFGGNDCSVVCPAGMTGPDCGRCRDRLADPAAGCQTCVANADGSANVECSCRAGFVASPDKRSCLDFDECAAPTNPCGTSTCVNNAGSFSCDCATGYLAAADGKSCVDIDECAAEANPCGAGSCTNSDGGYACTCPGGYVAREDSRACDDVDECAAAANPCGAGTCVNGAGSYSCTCPAGYRLNGNRKGCEEVDECAEAAPCGSGTCTNSPGSYSCACPSGYVRRSDGTACDDVDECASTPCGTAVCSNRPGTFSCTCPAGYALRADGKACEDVDECANGTRLCDINAACTNKPGSYDCTCNAGFIGDGRACRQRSAGELVTKNLAGVTLEFSYIPAGTFTMGSPASDAEARAVERPQHQVTLTRPFLLLRNEVTQAQYQAVVGSNPSYFTGDASRPVERVSWYDAVAFCTGLEQREGVPAGTYGLPTEAQWEYAARAGTTTPRYGNLDEIGWYSVNSGNTTRPVWQKRANAWQLYDMLGNVLEWTADWYGDYTSSAQTNPTGPASGSVRVVRGGSWGLDARYARAAGFRDFLGGNPGDRGFNNQGYGFRIRRLLP
jgi:formylglycine-generating enzyme required for sulfatase activity